MLSQPIQQVIGFACLLEHGVLYGILFGFGVGFGYGLKDVLCVQVIFLYLGGASGVPCYVYKAVVD